MFNTQLSKIIQVSLIFLAVLYFTLSLDLALASAVLIIYILFRIPGVYLFSVSFIFFFFYLVSVFIELKSRYVFDFSVSSYVLFISALIIKQYIEKKSSWKVFIPGYREILISSADLLKVGIVLFFLFLIYPITGPQTALISAYIVLMYMYKRLSDGRFAFSLALFFLVLCPFLLSFDKEKTAESSAVFAYYFLCIGTFQELVSLWKNRGKMSDRPDDILENDTGNPEKFLKGKSTKWTHLKYR